jgi:predicted acylesterase/phospholipase RssA
MPERADTALGLVARLVVLGLVAASASGCIHTLFVYTNTEEPHAPCPQDASQAAANDAPAYAGKATFNVVPMRGKTKAKTHTLVILALSGGGSRAAYWSAKAMLRLQTVFHSDNPDDDLDILGEVDAISSVSGGSLPAAYYAISTDATNQAEPSRSRHPWDDATVSRLMGRNYIVRWFGNWFWPANIAKFWFTGFNRTDIMAQTLAGNLYSASLLDKDLTIGDLRPSRPYLILNATNGTRGLFGDPFTFTNDNFISIRSHVDDYSLARAVMGTATFPAVFNYMTLRDYRDQCRNAQTKPQKQYVHVFDGGNYDNLGLNSVITVFNQLDYNQTKYSNVVVILVDAYTDHAGVAASRADPRAPSDYIVDRDVVASTDALLQENRTAILRAFTEDFKNRFGNERMQHALFYQLQFSDVANAGPEHRQLSQQLNSIPTNFSINSAQRQSIDEAVQLLLTPQNTCLLAIKSLLTAGRHALASAVCSYPPKQSGGEGSSMGT